MMLEEIGSIFIKIKVFVKAYRWICLENKVKVTKDNISNDCSQNTDSNNKNLFTSFH